MTKNKNRAAPIERLNAGATHPAVHQADALSAGPFVYVSGLMADDGVNGLAAEAQPKPGYPYYESAVKLQMRHILTKIRGILAQAGLEMDHVVKAHAFLTDPADFLPMDEVWREFFRTKVSRTFVRAGALPVAGARLCVDVIACRPDSGLEIARGNAGPPPPFSQKVEATRVGDLIFTSGQLGYDSRFGFPPEARRLAGDPAAGPDVVRQSRYTLANLGKSFASVGGKAENVAKAQVYLTDGTTWAPFMHDWRSAFATPPALTVAEEGLFVPEGLLEIDVTGYIPRTGLATGPVGEPAGPAGAPSAFRVGELLFASGRIAVDGSGMVPLEATVHPTWPNYGSAIKLQTRWVLDRLAETFAAAGSDLSRACRANVFLTDLNHFEAMETVWREYFPEPPARTLVGSPGLGHPDALIAVDLIGLCG